ncbi:MAG: ABC transporter substrate-binding protein [Novosphingobium sp.]|uniref:ABC transporter substrate-binding protein n=1 Tax=Novosphingobium sp. TaxID=1874826 RepID=UPI001D2AC785|nr:ABC transporter substrate-binding protein [Novosphingobium sp.]MCB2057774.1 ABC transporter substrate-binding protein [Novosphingobium sp.]MCP5386174.1 ABC transporter substrate-binding protein [Novosphingobium sp.]
MPSFRPSLIASAALLGALQGCGDDSARPVEVAVIGDPGGLMATGPRLPASAQLLRSAISEGLVGFDEQGRVTPALADRWIVTDDGLSYIFRLRDGTWPDGSEITGESARAALLRAIAAVRGTPLGLDLAVIGEVRTMAGRVIEIRLDRQSPDLLQLLAQPELGLLNRGRGAGPMRLVSSKNGALLRLIAPEDRGLPAEEDWGERVRRLRLAAIPGGKAVEAFNAGEADMVLGGRVEDFPRLDASGVPRGAIRLDPVSGLFGLMVVRGDGFLGKPENREALAMAIDRDALATALNIGGWSSTTRVVNPRLAGDDGSVGERWPGRSLDDRRAQASKRVDEWKSGGKEIAPIRIALPSGPGADVLFKRLAADLEAVGLKARRVGSGADTDLRLVDTVARYARADWFLNQLSCGNARGLCSPTADQLATKAQQESDPAKRADLYAQAEAQLTIANNYLPLGVPIRWSLVSGGVTGFAVNPWNIHPLVPLALKPRR